MPLQLDQPPDRLCIVRLSAIGDTCHTLPVVRTIQRAWPDTEITWIIGRVEHSLMQGLEGIRFAVLDKSRGWRGYFDLRRQIDTHRFPLLLHMHPSQRANLASLAVSAPLRLGFDRARARDMHYYFCNRRIEARTHEHVMDSLFGFSDALGIERKELRWDIPIGQADREFAAQTISAERPSLIISPCAISRFRNYRNWRADRYAQVADYAATSYGADIFLTGGGTEQEAQYGAEIESGTQCRVTNLIGKTSLKQLLSLIARASVVVCPDSGPAHMATAVATPVVGLYATTNPVRAAPYLSKHLVVNKYPEAVQAEFGVPVEAIRFGRRVRKPEAMDLIGVHDVAEKLDMAFAARDIRPVRAR